MIKRIVVSEEYFFGQFGPEHFEKMKAGVDLFNEQKYWECHEELEHHWLEDAGDNARLIYWAIIQVAAAMYHFRESNLEGVHGLLAKAKNKFQRATQHNVETDYLREHINWEEFKNLVMNSPERGELVVYQEIYDFRFKGSLWK